MNPSHAQSITQQAECVENQLKNLAPTFPTPHAIPELGIVAEDWTTQATEKGVPIWLLGYNKSGESKLYCFCGASSTKASCEAMVRGLVPCEIDVQFVSPVVRTTAKLTNMPHD